MSDEEFCVRAALLVGECPALCCPGGDHGEIPDVCMNWWNSSGWEIMEWEGQSKEVSSATIKKRIGMFLKELESNQACQQNQINKSDRSRELVWSCLSQQKGNLGEKLMDEPNENIFHSFAQPQILVQAASTNQNAAEIELQTLEKAKAISRSDTPACLHVKDLIPLGISHAGSLGILCRWPSLPINGNEIVPMNGDCIWTCFTHANDPTLRGAALKQAVWELRVRAVGTFKERLKLFRDDQWAILQAIVTGDKKVTPSRDEIELEVEKYMESGEYSGDFGDVIINIAASFLQQPVLVIEFKDCRVTTANWVVGKINL